MRLNQVTVPAAELDASIAFYRQLGFKLIIKSPHYARFELPDGGATFSLYLANGEIPREHTPQIYFECDDVEAEFARLVSQGVAFEHAPKLQTWLWCEAWLRDPAGNALCLYHAGVNRTHPPWRIEG